MPKIKKIKDRENTWQTVSSYDYDGLAHWWAYNNGRNSTASHRMSCAYEYIYSYDLTIAHMYDGRDKDYYVPTILILSGEGESNTTNKHINAVKSAIGHMNVITVSIVSPHTAEQHTHNFEFLMNKITEAAKKLPRCRSSNMKDKHTVDFQRGKMEAKAYATQFKQKSNRVFKKILAIGNITDEDTLQSINAAEKREEKRIQRAKRKAQQDRIKANKERSEKAVTNLVSWLSGESDTIPETNYISGGESVYIRIKGAVIETTNHAHISLKAALRAYKKYRNGELEDGEDISGFIFGGVEDDIATIGCTDVPLKQIEDLFKGRIT